MIKGESTTIQRAVIYCRVSSKKQTVDGSGLESQEHRCRLFAEQRGYVVDAVFPDDVSGGGDFMNRPGMVALLSYLDAKPHENYVVIFDDLKRYARDTEFHLKLRRVMAERGATRECLNFNFEDTPEGRFIETMLAAQGQLEREQNGRQVVQKMRARVEQGFWVFRAPVGYRFVPSKRGGKELVPDEPLASIVKHALNGFATGYFQTQVEVQRFLESKPEYPKDMPNGKIRPMTITRFLKKPVYAGYVECKKWGVSLREGHHDGLIDFATHKKILQRLEDGALAPARKDIATDFVLRGFVGCGECGRPLTSAWSKSSAGKLHPYYRCHHRPCSNFGKSIKRDVIEDDFDEVVKQLAPAPGMIELASAMFKDAWKQRTSQGKQAAKHFEEELKDLEKQVDDFLQRIVESNNPRVIQAYESKIEKLEDQRLLLREKALKTGKPRHTFEQMFELAMLFLTNPYEIWRSGNFQLRRILLRLAFLERPRYCRKDGCLNVKKSLPFNLLGSKSMFDSEMVLPERFELSTSPLPRECSTPELRQHRLGTSFWSTQRRQNKCFGT
jgi:site-specific DNA recombinase